MVAEHALDDEREAEGQEQAVEVIEVVEPTQEEALDQDAGEADDDRRDDECPPVIQTGVLQQEISRKGAHHVLGAVREIDDVEQSEDDGETEAQQRIERTVDQPDQQLPEQGLRGNAEDFEHAAKHVPIDPTHDVIRRER